MDELVKRLRDIAGWDWNGGDGEYVERAVKEAADAIAELSHDYEKLAEDFNGAVELLHKRSKPR